MGGKVVIAIVAVLVLAVAGLAVYGSQVTPKREAYEEVVPDARLPQ